MAARAIPMGTSYVVWGGIGAVGTTIVGMIWFGEPIGAMRLGLIVAIIACVAGLKALA
jgi:quaternary ammonium compound-resistance protein SugE